MVVWDCLSLADSAGKGGDALRARHQLLLLVLGFGVVSAFGRAAGPSPKRDVSKETTAVAVVPADDAAMRVQGEQRFRANCGRCHASPQKFPPRIMKTVIRHMRVRATITDEDVRSILFYVTQ